MKTTFTKFSLIALLIMSLSNLSAQWSEIGGAGFSPSFSQRNATAVSGSTLYMAYMDGSGNATVMKSTGSTWSVVGTGSFSPTGSGYIDIAVNASGVPYVAFTDNASKVRVMNFNGTIWTSVGTATIANAGTAQDIALSFDNTNAPCVLFSDGSNANKASVYRFNGTSWAPMGIAGFSAGQALIMSMAKSPSTGALYVVYQDNANLNWATVMTFNGTNWVLVGTAGGASTGSSVSDVDIAVSNSGTPHIIYPDFVNGNRATVRAFNGTSWAVVGTQGFSAGAASYNGIVFNSTGTPYVAYRDGGNSARASAMMYNGTAWTTIGTAGFSGSTVTAVSILINSAGQPCVGYSDASVSSRATVMKYCTSATSSILSVSAGTTCGTGSVVVSGTVSAGNIYWYNSPTNGSYVSGSNSFTPTISSNTTYYAAPVDINGCVSATRTAVTATVIPVPSVTAAIAASVCTGNSAVISATPSAGTINWYTGSITGTLLATGNSFTTPVQNASGNFVYYAEANNQGCYYLPRTAVTVTVRPTPTITISGTTSICNGNSTTLTMGGSAITTWTWSTGSTTNSILVSPTITTTYSINAQHFQGCSNSKTISVTVNPNPTVAATSSSTLICTGNTATLSATGATTFSWNPGNLSGTSVAVSPTLSTTYTVVGSTSGCTDTKTVAITVSACTGINETTNSNTAISVYPNPNNGEFNLVVPEEGMYMIVNSIGQTVETIDVKENSQTIFVQDLAAGIYYVIGKSAKAKIVVNK